VYDDSIDVEDAEGVRDVTGEDMDDGVDDEVADAGVIGVPNMGGTVGYVERLPLARLTCLVFARLFLDPIYLWFKKKIRYTV
jgi:hypothetical protein